MPNTKKHIKSILIGIVNGLVPCGWLYIFVMGSVSTKDPLYGAMFMLLFWLGTLPALNILPAILNNIDKKLKIPIRMTALAGILLITIGITNTLFHYNSHHLIMFGEFSEFCGSKLINIRF